MMTNWEVSTSPVPFSQLLITVPNGGQNVRVAALVAAAVLLGGVTTAGHASSLSPLRIGAERVAVQPSARDKDVSFSVSDAMALIKRRTGASWDNLAVIFGVSRQAVHLWVKGGAIKAVHEEKVRALLDQIEQFSGLRPFQILSQLLSEAGAVHSNKLAVSEEPVILTADHTPLTQGLRVVGEGKTKILRA